MEKLNHSIFWKVNQKQRFGFRKLSIGLAAVTLSTTLFLTTTKPIKADSATDPAQTSLVVQNKAKDSSTDSVTTQAEASTKADESSSASDKSFDATTADASNVETNKEDNAQASNSPVKSNNNSTVASSKTSSEQNSTPKNQENSNADTSATNDSKTTASDAKSASSDQNKTAPKKEENTNSAFSSSEQTLVINKGQNDSSSTTQKQAKTKQPNLAKELTDSKIESSSKETKTPSVSVNWTNKPSNNTVMADNDNEHLDIQLKTLPGAKVNDSFTLNIGNSSDWKVTGAALNSPYFQISNGIGTNSLTLKVIKDYNTSNKLSVDLPVIVRAIKTNANKVVDLPVTLTDNQTQKEIAEDNSIQKVTVTPLKDTTNNEAEKPFYIGYVNDDGNLPSEDQGKKVQQWGLYWNYGQNSSSKQMTFDLHVSDGQTIIPSSIKVFVVNPADAIKKDGTRKDLSDYYNKVVTGQIDQDLQNLFRTSVKNGTEIKFDGTNYSTKTFFIQFDTMPSDDIVKNNKQTSVTVSPAFWWTQGGNGKNNTVTAYSDPIVPGSSVGTYNAYLHFADVTNSSNIKDLDSTLNLSNPVGDFSTTPDSTISFANINNLINQLEKDGYELVGISTGKLTNSQNLASGNNVDNFLQRNDFGNLTEADQHFTLDFKKKTKTPSKSSTPSQKTNNNSGTEPTKPSKPGKPNQPNQISQTTQQTNGNSQPTAPSNNPQTSNVQPQPETPVTPVDPSNNPSAPVQTSNVEPHAENSSTPAQQSSNVQPHAEAETPTQNNETSNSVQTVAPHAESVKTSNKAHKTIKETVAPYAQSVKSNKQEADAPDISSNKKQKAPQLAFRSHAKVQKLAAKVYPVINKSKAKASLPQTGERQNFLSIIGAGLIALAGLFGLTVLNKRRKN